MTDELLYAEDTLQATITFKDENEVLYDPSSVEICILNQVCVEQQGATPLDLTDLTKASTGTYTLLWNLPAAAEKGVWTIVITGYYSATSIERTKKAYFTCGGTRI